MALKKRDGTSGTLILVIRATQNNRRVLREAGFVESRIEAQRRLYRLRPEPLMELDAWLVPFRRFWSKHVDALERHLEKMEKVP